jgi:hypothetical protein
MDIDGHSCTHHLEMGKVSQYTTVVWVCVAVRTQEKVLEGKKPSPVVPTATLFGPLPLAYEDSYYG